MSSKNSGNKTKVTFKLPQEIKKHTVEKAYSTSKNVNIEGYTGKIETIGSTSELPKDGIHSCRPIGGHNGRAWIQARLN